VVFAGIQKLTLLDYPDRTACTVFTAGCNFNCPFCQNASLIKSATREQSSTHKKQKESAAEILRFLETRQGLLDGVCISGGEPLLHSDPDMFISDVKALGYLVKLDTNGSYPEKMENLIKAGLIDYVAMDIKNTPEKYAQTIGASEYDISQIEDSIAILRKGTIPYEFRTTVVREYHTGDDLLSIAHWISDTERYYLQKFVDSDGVAQNGLHGYSDTEMQQFLSDVRKILPAANLRGM